MYLKGIVQGGQPGTGCPCHDIALLGKESSLVRKKRTREEDNGMSHHKMQNPHKIDRTEKTMHSLFKNFHC